uniref:Uncharacterized protein n=1 Tax=Oryza glumipatula TaxID=40148 RepID=A0A0E0ARW8_9ORYZ
MGTRVSELETHVAATMYPINENEVTWAHQSATPSHFSRSFLRRDRTLTNSHLLGAMPRSPSPSGDLRRRRRRKRGTGRTCRGTR